MNEFLLSVNQATKFSLVLGLEQSKPKKERNFPQLNWIVFPRAEALLERFEQSIRFLPEQKLMFTLYREMIAEIYDLLKQRTCTFKSVLSSYQKAQKPEKKKQALDRLRALFRPIVRELLFLKTEPGQQVVADWEWGELSNNRFNFPKEFSSLIVDYLLLDLLEIISCLKKYFSQKVLFAVFDMVETNSERDILLVVEYLVSYIAFQAEDKNKKNKAEN